MKKYFFILLILISLFFNAQSKNQKIALIGAHDQKYDHIGKYAHLNKRKYAKKHGYDIFLYTENLDPSRLPYWTKVKALQRHLKDYDWLFWLDSDALIMNFNIKLENMIDQNYDFITTRDCHFNVNSGQFLIKNSAWSEKFLKDWYSLNNISGLDNDALIKLHKEYEEIRNHFKILPQRNLSSYMSFVCPLSHKIDGIYKKGDFVIHFAGIPDHKKKEKYMKRFFKIANSKS